MNSSDHLAARVLSLYAIVLALLMCMPAGNAIAQWTLAAPQLLLPRVDAPIGTVLKYQHGLLWAASDDVYMSSDLGVTWHQRSAPMGVDEVVTDIDWYDDQTGAISTFGVEDARVYITNDQGRTWRMAVAFTAVFQAVTFLGTPDDILVVGNVTLITRNQGNSWNAVTFAHDFGDVMYLGNDSVIMMKNVFDDNSRFWTSADGAQTWSEQPGLFDQDCYSFERDSARNFYVVNDDYYSSQDLLSEIFSSTDIGTSWNSLTQLPLPPNATIPQYCGSLAAASCALYAQTGRDGVVRSIDDGKTWVTIGGPDGIGDSRAICAINNDVVLAIDQEGSIWKTVNSGGSPLTPSPHTSAVLLTEHSLFMSDTLTICADPGNYIDRTISLLISDCASVGISGYTLTGTHAASYSVLSYPRAELRDRDEILIRFTPVAMGVHRARLEITYADGSTTEIALGGNGASSDKVVVGLGSVILDTLGGSACLPLTFEPDTIERSVTLTIMADDLEFETAIGADGNSYPMTVLPSGELSVTFPRSAIGSSGASLCFRNVVAMPRSIYDVRVTALATEHPQPTCAFVSEPEVGATITVPVECGTLILSDHLKNGKLPSIVVRDLPGLRVLEVRSLADVHGAAVRLFDLMGSVVRETSIEGNAAHLNYSGVAAGTHFVEVLSALGQQIFRVVLN